MNNKIIIAVVGILVIIFAVYMLMQRMGSDSMSGDSMNKDITQIPKGMEDGDVTVEENGMKEFTISGKNYAYNVQQLNVKKGDTVKITFISEEGTHDWNVDEFNAHTKILSSGKTETIEFVADKIGTFEYYCSVMNHRAQGMVGNLIVTE